MPTLDPQAALAHWPVEGPLRPAPDAGLINETWLVGDADRPSAVFQWLNPITHPRIHEDVAAVTARLADRGLGTPRLIPTRDGELWLPQDRSDPWTKGCWRLWSYVPGVTLHRLESAVQATAAGDLVGRFHAAMSGWNYEFQAPRRNVHHTPSRMADLESAIDECGDHPLAAEAGELGESILDGWRTWREGGTLDLPERACHGDLKISNLRFSNRAPAREAPEGVCLLDLDTIGPQTLAAEMGDAWRSWCNPAGEDEPDAVRFDFEFFAASARAWAQHVANLEVAPLTDREIDSLVPGIERISLELSARFCADVLRNSYFKEDRQRFPEVGRHNLLRATSQRRLARLVRAERGRCLDLIEELFR